MQASRMKKVMAARHRQTEEKKKRGEINEGRKLPGKGKEKKMFEKK